MRYQYVKTSNHLQFMTAVHAVEAGAAPEARIILLAGEPGTGKTRCVDHFGAERNAIYVNGLPGMTLGYIRELLAHELGVPGGTKFQIERAIQEQMLQRQQTIILDEAQHGLDRKAECIEYLRRIAELSSGLLVLVCHTSERHRFGEHKLAHIATRISKLCEFKTASLEDCRLYLSELCEVDVDDGIVKFAFEQSRGRYRLLASVCSTLEGLAKKWDKSRLTEADVKGVMLCEDAMKSLRKGAK